MPMAVKIAETDFPGVLLVETGCFCDARGFFSETYSESMWRAAGFTERFVQDNLSLSAKGVMRGLHYQIDPHGMGKLIRVVTGGIFDVGVDLRRGSPTFGQCFCQELSAENRLSLWLPAGFAHGFLALEDDTLVHYKCNAHHAPEAERAIRYDDPALAIPWPFEPTIISPKDAQAPLLRDAEYNFVFAD